MFTLSVISYKTGMKIAINPLTTSYLFVFSLKENDKLRSDGLGWAWFKWKTSTFATAILMRSLFKFYYTRKHKKYVPDLYNFKKGGRSENDCYISKVYALYQHNTQIQQEAVHQKLLLASKLTILSNQTTFLPSVFLGIGLKDQINFAKILSILEWDKLNILRDVLPHHYLCTIS